MTKGFEKFISGLEEIYGRYDVDAKKFARKSNSDIARDLFYSDSQFSRLINKSASEGEYLRANKIISRHQENLALQKKLKQQRDSTSYFKSIVKNPWAGIPLALGLAAAVYIGYYIASKKVNELSINTQEEVPMDYMLKWAFEMSEVQSYAELKDLPPDCIYPCYRLQGKWKLKDNYKLPVFGEQRGFHYLATDVNMYARCMSENESNGTEMEGYEYQKHEIWYDLKEQPIESFMTNSESSELTESYKMKDFSQDENYVLVAHVHTFFRNTFHLDEKNIERKGKVIGRYIEYKDLSGMEQNITNLSAADIEQEIRNIVNTRVEDFSRPIQCGNARLDKATVYDIEENDIMGFQCTMTTGRLPIMYMKKYVLVDQVIKNACRVKQ